MTIDEIVMRAIPLTFPGVQCAARETELRLKAERRRVELTNSINQLIRDSHKVETQAY